MKKAWCVALCGWFVLWYVLHAASTAAASRDDIAYWRATYKELKPEQDARAQQAHAIFARLLQSAGKRPDVVQRLFITASDPWDIALPIAIRDGWIVLSKSALDLCYRDAPWGNDRLAFVLAHEIAHQLNDDLWHLRFAQAFEVAHRPQGRQQPELRQVWEEVQRAAADVERVYDRELRADERGILYTAIAGFNSQAIFTERQHGNFFAEWLQGLALDRLGLPTRPTPTERYEAMRSRLHWVANQSHLFQLGLWSYYAGNYSRAIQAFAAFRPVFPSRETLHNLGVSHHQFALQAYQYDATRAPLLPFQLSLSIEPLTRASKIDLERTRNQAPSPANIFHHHLHEAIHAYEEALILDRHYIPAAINLGAAFLLRGTVGDKPTSPADIADAIARLARARDIEESPELLNNLGVAWFYDGQLERARTTLQRAQALSPTYAAPVYNLGMMAHLAGRAAEEEHLRQRYQQLTVQPALTRHPATRPESLEGMTLGQIASVLPRHIGTPTQSSLTMHDKTFTVVTYPAGVASILHEGGIVLLIAQQGYQGHSERGMKIGSPASEVLAHYGQPSRRHHMPQGDNWSYDEHRIAFQLRDGHIVSWLIF